MTAPKSRGGLMEVDSDSDSIATDTTAGSEADSEKEYEIEKLLAEEIDTQGETKYLVKWAGYPLGQCTWEPIDSGPLLVEWAHEKEKVRRGVREAFDVDLYNAAYERWREEVDEKRERRRAKRRRRAMRRGEDVMDFEPEIDSPPRKPLRQSHSTPVRKGVAQTVKKGRRESGRSDGSPGLWVPEDEESASEPEDAVEIASTSAGKHKDNTNDEKAREKTDPASSSTQKRQREPSSSTGQPAKKSAHSLPSLRHSSPPQPAKHTTTIKESSITGARKSAPAPASKPPAVKRVSESNVFAGDWAKEKQPRQRRQVSGEDANGSTFRKLSTQNRINKHGQKEPAPDPTMLSFIDPRTMRAEPSKPEAPKKDATTRIEPVPRDDQHKFLFDRTDATRPAAFKATTSSGNGPTDVQSAYSRRSPPPRARRRSPVRSGSGDEVLARPTVPPAQPSTRPEMTAFEPTSTKHLMCKEWLDGKCPYPAGQCWFAHTVNPNEIVPKRYVTCFFWKRGGCRKGDSECEFAHRDTGIYAVAPKDDTRRASMPGGGPDVLGTNAAITSDANRLVSTPAQPSASSPNTVRESSAPPNKQWIGKKATTCYFWKNGGCNKSDSECSFAHFDTGIYAGEPGTYLETRRRIEAMSHTGATHENADPRLASTSSPAGQATPHSPSHRRQSAAYEPLKGVNNTPSAPGGTSATGASQVEVAPPIIADAIVHSPTTETTDHRGGESPTNDNANLISTAKDPRLRGRIQTAAASPEEVVPPTRTDSMAPRLAIDELEMARASAIKLNYSFMLSVKGGGIENVFIHMPGRSAEVDLLKDYFKKFNCKVFTELMTWPHFRDTLSTARPGSLLILHPSEVFVRSLPGLHSFLREHSYPKQVFSIGVQHELCLRERRPPAYEALRLFPHGGLYFISDDVFVYYPEKATAIIDAFLEQTKHKPPGAETQKIGARPGIKDWMMRLASQKYTEQSSKGQSIDTRWIACYEALCRLCPPQDEDPYFDPQHVPLDSSYLWSTWEESLPSLKGLWESGNEKEATDYLANHFAGEACSKTWKYRRFLFIYQRPDDAAKLNSQGLLEEKHGSDPRGWGKRYDLLGVVGPDWVLKMFNARRKGQGDMVSK